MRLFPSFRHRCTYSVCTWMKLRARSQQRSLCHVLPGKSVLLAPPSSNTLHPPCSFHHRVRFACRNLLKHLCRPLRSNDTVAPKSGSGYSSCQPSRATRETSTSLLCPPFFARTWWALRLRCTCFFPPLLHLCCSIRARFLLVGRHVFGGLLESSTIRIESKYVTFYVTRHFSLFPCVFIPFGFAMLDEIITIQMHCSINVRLHIGKFLVNEIINWISEWINFETSYLR